jgi:hypothetical protein
MVSVSGESRCPLSTVSKQRLLDQAADVSAATTTSNKAWLLRRWKDEELLDSILLFCRTGADQAEGQKESDGVRWGQWRVCVMLWCAWVSLSLSLSLSLFLSLEDAYSQLSNLYASSVLQPSLITPSRPRPGALSFYRYLSLGHFRSSQNTCANFCLQDEKWPLGAFGSTF